MFDREVTVKHVFFLSMVLLALGSTSKWTFAEVTATVEPGEVFVGEAARLTISSQVAVPEEARLPEIDGLQWFGGPSVSQRSQWVDGRHAFIGTASYTFRCDREGAFRLAGVAVRIRGELVEVPAVEVTVRRRRFAGRDGQELTMADLLRVEARYAHPRDGDVGHAFVGEEIPLLVEVYAAEPFRPTFNYPSLEVDQAVVRDYSARNQHSNQFDVGTVADRIERGVRFKVASFRSAVTPLAAGTLEIKGRASTVVNLQRNQRDFFSDVMPFSRSGSRQTLVFSLPPLIVSSPPPLPDEAGAYLGLVGDWRVEFSVSETRVRVGESVVVTMRATGTGSLMGFQAPRFELPGYRSYEPEVQTTAATGEIVSTWVMIPLASEAGDLTMTAYTLDPRRREYVRHELNAAIEIQPGEVVQANGAIYDPNGGRPGRGAAARPRVSSLLYIKDKPGAGVALPIWRNRFVPVLVIYLSGVLFLAGAVFGRLLGLGRLPDERAARRRSAVKRRAAVAREMWRASPELALDVARHQVVPWLADLWGCPPGSTADELAKVAATAAPELADELRNLECDGFSPERRPAHFDGQRLARAVKRLPCPPAVSASRSGRLSGFKAGAVFLAATLGLSAWGDSTVAGQETFAGAVAAYDAGEYTRSREIFETLGRVDAEAPVLLYNRANCLFEEGRPAEALALYERAARLAPRDSDIRENLNFVRSELGLPTVGSAQTPGELVLRVRDSLRPDEWLLGSAVCFGIGMVWAAMAVVKRGRFIVPLILALLGTALLLGIVRSQMTSRYRPASRAVATSRQAVAFTHPAAQARTSEFVPLYGESLEVVEKRTGWSRVRGSSGEAWMADEQLAFIW